MPAYMFVYHCGSGAHGVKKVALNPLEFALQIVVSCHVGAGNKIWVFYKSSNLTDELYLQPTPPYL